MLKLPRSAIIRYDVYEHEDFVEKKYFNLNIVTALFISSQVSFEMTVFKNNDILKSYTIFPELTSGGLECLMVKMID